MKNAPDDQDTPGRTAWQLLLADDPKVIAEIEAEYGKTQEETANDFIENSCWTPSVPDFVGGKGTAQERLIALRAAYFRQQ